MCDKHQDKRVEFNCKKESIDFCSLCLAEHFDHISEVKKTADQ